MAARRNKSQARRNTGGGASALPGWAWLVIGVLATLVVLLGLVSAGMVAAPKFLSGNDDGFFRPQPNPDAEPAPVDADAEAVVPEGETDTIATSRTRSAAPSKDTAATEDPDYDFYTLLPGKEVPMTEAEINATAQAEARRGVQARAAQQAATAPTAQAASLPTPVRDDAGATRPAVTAAGTAAATSPAAKPPASDVARPSATSATAAETPPPAPIGTDTRYLLQAGAFQASGQAEELKAKIAMLGLGARVESAQIKGKTVYRVRMGPYGTASDLSDAKRKLASGGLPGMAIKVD